MTKKHNFWTINWSKAEFTEYVIAQYVQVLKTESYDS